MIRHAHHNAWLQNPIRRCPFLPWNKLNLAAVATRCKGSVRSTYLPLTNSGITNLHLAKPVILVAQAVRSWGSKVFDLQEFLRFFPSCHDLDQLELVFWYQTIRQRSMFPYSRFQLSTRQRLASCPLPYRVPIIKPSWTRVPKVWPSLWGGMKK